MIIKPKVRNFLCLTAHPIGCQQRVHQDLNYVKTHGLIKNGAKKALILGASTGYGLASRMAIAAGMGAKTLGVMFEKPSDGKRTATPGFYNDAALVSALTAEGIYAKTMNGDAFSQTCKDAVIETIRQDLGEVDLVVYSLAAPRRTDRNGKTWTSVLKPIEHAYEGKTLNLSDKSIGQTALEPATPEEIEATVKVMGGEDWQDWIQALSDANVLAKGAITLAYSYIGPDVTAAIYRDGSIGQAKKDLYQTALRLKSNFADQALKPYVAINKAVVTQASAAIPSVSLYVSILYKLMKEKGTHEGCIEQMVRLFKDKLYIEEPQVDENGWLRLDDYELSDDIQAKICQIWRDVSTENIETVADIDGYLTDFYQLFGFHVPGVDYDADVASF